VKTKWITLSITMLVVALTVYFTVGTLYAPPRGGGRGIGRVGPGNVPGQPNNPQDQPQATSYVDGVIKVIKPAKDDKPASLDVLGKKGGKGSDVKYTFGVTPDTQIFIGDDPKELSDLKVGDKVNVAYSKPPRGGAVALVIRVMTDKPDATNKGGGDAPPGAAKGE